MQIYFITKQTELCERIAELLEVAGYKCIVFGSSKMLLHLVNSDDELPDLLVLDYTMIQHDILNIFKYLRKNGRDVPVIFYNDPYPTKTTRATFWAYQNSTHYIDMDITKIRPAFQVIANAVDSPELYPYIPLIHKPKKYKRKADLFTEAEIDSTDNDNENNESEYTAEKMQNKKPVFNIYDFRKKTDMNPAIFHLLEYLYERKGTYVSTEELSNIILQNGKTAKEKSVSSYISRLRSYLKQVQEVQIDILFANKSYKLIIY